MSKCKRSISYQERSTGVGKGEMGTFKISLGSIALSFYCVIQVARILVTSKSVRQRARMTEEAKFQFKLEFYFKLKFKDKFGHLTNFSMILQILSPLPILNQDIQLLLLNYISSLHNKDIQSLSDDLQILQISILPFPLLVLLFDLQKFDFDDILFMHFFFCYLCFGCVLQSQEFNFDEVLFLSFVTCPFDVLSKKS